MMRASIPADELLHKASAVGQYYGFTPFTSLIAATRGSARKRAGYPETLNVSELDPIAETVASFLRQFQN